MKVIFTGLFLLLSFSAFAGKSLKQLAAARTVDYATLVTYLRDPIAHKNQIVSLLNSINQDLAILLVQELDEASKISLVAAMNAYEEDLKPNPTRAVLHCPPSGHPLKRKEMEMILPLQTPSLPAVLLRLNTLRESLSTPDSTFYFPYRIPPHISGRQIGEIFKKIVIANSPDSEEETKVQADLIQSPQLESIEFASPISWKILKLTENQRNLREFKTEEISSFEEDIPVNQLLEVQQWIQHLFQNNPLETVSLADALTHPQLAATVLREIERSSVKTLILNDPSSEILNGLDGVVQRQGKLKEILISDLQKTSRLEGPISFDFLRSPQLEYVYIPTGFFGSNNLLLFFQKLKESRIKKLHILGFNIPQEGKSTFVESLGHNSSIEELTISGTDPETLNQILTLNSKIKTLKLYDMSWSDSLFLKFIELIKKGNIKSLILSDRSLFIPKKSILKLLEAISSNQTQITHLGLPGNEKFSTDDLIPFFSQLPPHCTVTSIDLAPRFRSNEGANQLARAVAKAKYIHTFHLTAPHPAFQDELYQLRPELKDPESQWEKNKRLRPIDLEDALRHLGAHPRPGNSVEKKPRN